MDKHGGPAFPAEEWIDSDSPRIINPTRHLGMSLRDYFAAQAIVASAHASTQGPTGLAKAAYEIADAMLKAREE
jgi:hypothetical protein